RRIPQDLAVVGVGEVELGRYLPVPLTYVALPRYETGKAAADLALRLVDGELPERSVVRLPVELIASESGCRQVGCRKPLRGCGRDFFRFSPVSVLVRWVPRGRGRSDIAAHRSVAALARQAEPGVEPISRAPSQIATSRPAR